ncbi:hypothetical protein [Pseudokineococcus sp. 1T1Z-3]
MSTYRLDVEDGDANPRDDRPNLLSRRRSGGWSLLAGVPPLVHAVVV